MNTDDIGEGSSSQALTLARDGGAEALPDARAAAAEARLIAAAWAGLFAAMRRLDRRARRVLEHLPRGGVWSNKLSDGARAAGNAERALRGLFRAAQALERRARLEALGEGSSSQGAVKGAGG